MAYQLGEAVLQYLIDYESAVTFAQLDSVELWYLSALPWSLALRNPTPFVSDSTQWRQARLSLTQKSL